MAKAKTASPVVVTSYDDFFRQEEELLERNKGVFSVMGSGMAREDLHRYCQLVRATNDLVRVSWVQLYAPVPAESPDASGMGGFGYCWYIFTPVSVPYGKDAYGKLLRNYLQGLGGTGPGLRYAMFTDFEIACDVAEMLNHARESYRSASGHPFKRDFQDETKPGG